MIALWIVLALLGLLLLIGLLRVGLYAAYAEQTFTLHARVGPVKLQVLPRPPGPEKPKKEKPQKPEKEAQTEKEQKWSLDQLLALAKLGLQAAGAFRRKISVNLFRLIFVAGAADPYDTAMQYAYVNAALGALRPLAERAVRIRRQDIQTGTDFSADRPQIEAALDVTIRIGQVAGIGVVFGCKYLIWKLRQKRAAKAQQPQAAAAAERKVSNG